MIESYFNLTTDSAVKATSFELDLEYVKKNRPLLTRYQEILPHSDSAVELTTPQKSV